MVSKVFWAQVHNPSKNDWWLSVQEDLQLFKLNHLTLGQIKTMSKHKFKKIVKEACKAASLEFLIKEKDTKNKSKLSKLVYSSLELQPYLKSDAIFNRTKKFLFKLRTRMGDVGYNFGKKIKCKICAVGNDNQENLMKCFMIKIRNQSLLQDLNKTDI